MIDRHSLSREWLEEKRKAHKKDPGIIESMIYALHLLEELRRAGLDFVFKGGTSLILLLDKPRRFSVDIDIIVNPVMKREELESYLEKVAANSGFTGFRLDGRRSYKGDIPKAHYIFTYRSNVPNKSKAGEVDENPEREILLDVLFADTHYAKMVEKPIKTPWLKLDGEHMTVIIPDINAIAGDKLTAFAPDTTGVPYHRNSVNARGDTFQSEMFMEIVKQVFDVGHLFDYMDDMEIFVKTYRETAESEIKYRPERKIESIEQVMQNTIDTALILAKRNGHDNDIDNEKFSFLQTGLGRFEHYVFDGAFRIEHIQVASAKAAYLAALVLHDKMGEFQRFDADMPLASYLITHPDYNFLNKKLKFVEKGEALFYWSKIVGMQK